VNTNNIGHFTLRFNLWKWHHIFTFNPSLKVTVFSVIVVLSECSTW